MAQNSIRAIPLTQLDAATLLITYQPVNPGGLPEACIILRIINGSNVAIAISYDGITDNDTLAANQTLQVNAQTNSQPAAQVSLWPKGTVVYARSLVAGIGNVNVAGYYNPR